MSEDNIKTMDISALYTQLTVLKKEFLGLRFKKALGELTDTSVIRKTRKKIARVFTAISLRANTKDV